MFRPLGRRRMRRGGLWPLLSRVFYINPQKQYMIIIVSAITMATFVFSGLLLFRQSDRGDLMNRGNWLMKQGKVAEAAKEYEKLVQIYRNSYEGHLQLGKAYLETQQPDKAGKEFRIASRLKEGDLRKSGAHIALSRMMIVEGKFDDAEKQLFQAYKARPENAKDPELLSALVDLYDEWGSSYLEQNPPNYPEAFIKFYNGLHYETHYDDQKPLQDKFVNTAKHLADIYSNNKDYDKAIIVLKHALHYEYNADNLIAIAAMYEQKEDLDRAIYWYRKAYDVDPKVISLKLSSMLMKKGKELNEAHQPRDAEDYFAEAKRINDTVKLPLENLYPVSANDVAIHYEVHSDAFDLSPMAHFSINNDGSYPINFLVTKVYFLTGDQKLADAQEVVATAQDPLAPHGEPRGSKTIDIRPMASIPLEDLDKGKLRVQVLVSYSDAPESKWYELKNAEITVKEAPTAAHDEKTAKSKHAR